MENFKGTLNFNAPPYIAKQTFLPPKIPFPNSSSSSFDNGPSQSITTVGIERSRDESGRPHPTSLENFLLEEQPYWLDDLLKEPDMPMHRRAHRRSSSDSFTFSSACDNNSLNLDKPIPEFYKHNHEISSLWGSDLNESKDLGHNYFYVDANPLGLQHQDLESSPVTERQELEKADVQNINDSSQGIVCANARPSVSEPDMRRAKQQYAQRSRVRKLQYIAELERRVQTSTAEISEAIAEVKFVEQQNLILNLECKALKQRLDSLSQEKLIKQLEQEMLEREKSRLITLYRQQQQQQQQQSTKSSQRSSVGHGRNNSKDLEFKLANLSLQAQQPNSSRHT